MIDIADLRFRYPEGEFALHIPRLEVGEGERVAVIGPSGSGKTTLLHLISGIRRAQSGSITTRGVEVAGLADGECRDFRIRHIGMVFQEFELLDHLSVLDNILLPYRITPALVLDGSVRTRARDLAERVGLGDKVRRPPRRLSQGERQRVGVCRALLPDPPLLFADEPTGNLDPDTSDRVLDLLFSYAEEKGATLLTVTHDHAQLDRFSRVLDAGPWGRRP